MNMNIKSKQRKHNCIALTKHYKTLCNQAYQKCLTIGSLEWAVLVLSLSVYYKHALCGPEMQKRAVGDALPSKVQISTACDRKGP